MKFSVQYSLLANAFDDWRVINQAAGQRAAAVLTDLHWLAGGRPCRIEGRPVTIDGDLYAATFQVRQPVDFFREIDPDGKRIRGETGIAGRSTEVKDFLPRWLNALTQQIGKHLWEPRPTGKNKTARAHVVSAHPTRDQALFAARRAIASSMYFLRF